MVLIPVISLAMHYRVIQLDLIGIHVWRQTQTQTVINNFAFEDFNILHPKYNTNPDTDRIMRMEFPIMQWVFAIFFKFFGNHIIISRLLTFIIGTFSVWGMYFLIKTIFKNTFCALIGAWAFCFSPEIYYYTINPLPDNFALCCGIWSAGFFFKWVNEKQNRALLLSFMFLSLATLVKLPFILYASLPMGYILMDYRANGMKSAQRAGIILAGGFTALLPPLIWYAMVIPTWNGNGVIKGIADNKLGAPEILHIIQSNLISTLPELLINYGAVLFFVAGFWFIVNNKVFKQNTFLLFVLWGLSIIAYFFFELNMIADVHDYYLFPFLPLIFIIVAYGALQLSLSARIYVRNLVILLLLILPLTAYLRTASRWDTHAPMVNIDLYQNKDELRKLVNDTDFCVVGNDLSHFIFLYYIDKKGWVFDSNNLSPAQLKEWTGKGAKYLFVDCPLDSLPGIKDQLGDKIFDKNSLRVYRLRENGTAK